MSIIDTPAQVRSIARSHRTLVLVQLGFAALFFYAVIVEGVNQNRPELRAVRAESALAIVSIAINVLQFAAIFQLMGALGYRGAALFWAFFGLFGCTALPIAIVLHIMAVQRLRKAGLHTNVFGVRMRRVDEYVERLSTDTCIQCGERLIAANVPCPMCGTQN